MANYPVMVNNAESSIRMRQELVSLGMDPHEARQYAPTLCTIFEDMRLENLLSDDGEMRTGPQYAGQSGAMALAMEVVPVTADQFVQLGRRYARIAMGLLGDQSRSTSP